MCVVGCGACVTSAQFVQVRDMSACHTDRVNRVSLFVCVYMEYAITIPNNRKMIPYGYDLCACNMDR